MHTTTPSNPFHARHGELDYDGAHWNYRASGARGPGLLLLGGALSGDGWSHRLVTLFEHSHRVLAPAYPKHARATEVIDGLIRLLDAEGLERVDLFGHELGAAVAHALVRRFPDRVDRVALAGWGRPTSFHRLSASSKLWALRFLPYSYLRTQWSELKRQLLIEHGDEREAAVLGKVAHALKRYDRASALAELQLMVELSRDGQGIHPAQPLEGAGRVLLLFPNDDPWFDRAEQEALTATYPGAQVVRFVWAGTPIGLGPALGLERKLELFFRRRPSPLRVVTGSA